MIKAIIFDFGEVLCYWDTQDMGVAESLAMGLSPDSIRSCIREYLHAAHRGEFSNFDEYLDETRPFSSQAAAAAKTVFEAMDRSARVDERMVALIRSLKPRYKIGLLSNFSNGLEGYLGERFQIRDLFDVVVSSYDQRNAKPAADIFIQALKQLSARAAESVFIDDVLENVEAGQSLGMPGIVFESYEQCRRELVDLLEAESAKNRSSSR